MTCDLLKRAVKWQKAAAGGELWKEASQGKASLPSTAPADGLEARLNAQGTPRVRLGVQGRNKEGIGRGQQGLPTEPRSSPGVLLKLKNKTPKEWNST